MLLYLLSLLAVEWDVKSAAELAVAIVIGLVVVIGGLAALAWSVSQRGRTEWLKMADDFVASASFVKAVNQASELFIKNLTYEIHGYADNQIEKHDQDVNAHRPAIKHGMASVLQTGEYTHGRNIQLLQDRVALLEKRVDGLKRDA